MTTVYEIRQLSAWVRGVRGAVQRATFRAYARTLQTAERDAKINARNNFRGTRIRPKTGNLMNSIFSGYVLSKGGPNGGDLVDGVVGVKSHKGREGTRPYGRIHEYGGVITPKRAKYLWIPLLGPKSNVKGGRKALATWSPSFFLEAKDAGKWDFHYWILPGKKGGKVAGVTYAGVSKPKEGPRKVNLGGVKRVTGMAKVRTYTVPLFALKDSVKLPARPYVRPAVEKAQAALPGAIAAEVAKTKPKPEGGE